MTRGNQRDNDRAKAQKKAAASVRFFLLPPILACPDRSFTTNLTISISTERQEQSEWIAVCQGEGGCCGYYAREAEEG
jgi:hypothetical protein